MHKHRLCRVFNRQTDNIIALVCSELPRIGVKTENVITQPRAAHQPIFKVRTFFCGTTLEAMAERRLHHDIFESVWQESQQTELLRAVLKEFACKNIFVATTSG